MRLMNLQDIEELASEMDERELNDHLLDCLFDGRLSRANYLEYLEITQNDIFDCLVEANPDMAFRG